MEDATLYDEFRKCDDEPELAPAAATPSEGVTRAHPGRTPGCPKSSPSKKENKANKKRDRVLHRAAAATPAPVAAPPTAAAVIKKELTKDALRHLDNTFRGRQGVLDTVRTMSNALYRGVAPGETPAAALARRGNLNTMSGIKSHNDTYTWRKHLDKEFVVLVSFKKASKAGLDTFTIKVHLKDHRVHLLVDIKPSDKQNSNKSGVLSR